MDYYDILNGLARSATDNEVKQAYRKQALHWHPSKNTEEDAKEVAQKFRDISEAYYVLTNPKLRAIFDQWGEQGLKDGVSTVTGGSTGRWVYNKDPDEQFSEFFGSTNPFASFFASTSDNNSSLSSKTADVGLAAKTQLTAIEQNIHVSLEELFQGCVKRAKIIRQRLSASGDGSTSPEDKILTLTIQPGWRENTKVTFKSIGDEHKDHLPGNVVFVVKERPHPRFVRSKDNLIYTAKISLKEALCGTTVNVKTLDGRDLPVAVNTIVQSGQTKIIVPGEGMPKVGKKGKRGKLVVTFDVDFPSVLSQQQKDAISAVL